MLWAIGSAVGFLLLTALVVILARSRTSQWERARSRRRPPSPPPVPPAAPPGRRSRLLRAGPGPGRSLGKRTGRESLWRRRHGDAERPRAGADGG